MALRRLCCGTCIGDRHLRTQLVPQFSKQTGRCGYCRRDNQLLVEPTELRDAFEAVIGIYRSSSEGKTLGEWFQADWAMFEGMSLAEVKELVGDILDDGQRARMSVAPIEDNRPADARQRWATFRQELMYENRFFPKTLLEKERLRELFAHLLLADADLPRVLFRARVHYGEQAFGVEDMGAPPQGKASHGRANPAGIPYLYLADNQRTAACEVRPHTGARVAVATFPVPEGLRVVDFAQPRRTASPFAVSESDVARLRNDISFLEELEHELRRPVQPDSAAVDYTPSQYLCEYVKHCGFHGVRYGSSVGEGFNYAVFDPSSTSATDVTMHQVSRVSVELLVDGDGG